MSVLPLDLAASWSEDHSKQNPCSDALEKIFVPLSSHLTIYFMVLSMICIRLRFIGGSLTAVPAQLLRLNENTAGALACLAAVLFILDTSPSGLPAPASTAHAKPHVKTVRVISVF